MSMYDGVTYKGSVPYSSFVPHLSVQSVPRGDSRTRQEFAAECDINTIMARYEKAGVLNHYVSREPRYLELDDVPDFQSAMNVFLEAKSAFMTLPAKVRREFDNDPSRFVLYAQDEKNLDQLREWGLAKPVEAPPSPVKVEVVASPSKLPEESPKAT